MSGKTLAEEQTELREAWRDLFYAMAGASGLIRPMERLGIERKRWVREREIRELHRK